MSHETQRVRLRPAEERDVEGIAAILAEPEVARWWGEPLTPEQVREELPVSFAIEVDGALAGWVQAHEETEADFRSVAFDIALATRQHGRGVGREALLLAVRHFVERGHHRFTIDPASANERAIRSYAAVGFKPVGILREAWRAPDGTWQDCLLMDLLARELS